MPLSYTSVAKYNKYVIIFASKSTLESLIIEHNSRVSFYIFYPGNLYINFGIINDYLVTKIIIFI